jgi:uncharacterized protein
MQCFGMDGPKRASKTALFDAARRWDVAAVRAILSAAPNLVEASDTKGRRALHIACAVNPRSGSHGEPNGIKTVTALLKAGAGLESEVPMDEDEGDFRATPVWYAVARGENLPLVRFLLSRGADPSYSLWAAVWRDDDVLCRNLLKARPRLNLRAHGETAIFYAARLKRLKTLETDQSWRRSRHQGRPRLQCSGHCASPPFAKKIHRPFDGRFGPKADMLHW